MSTLVLAPCEAQSSSAVLPEAVAHFAIHAAADPAALTRVIEHFALGNILPETVRCRRYVDGDLTIDIKVKGLDEKRASVIANKLQASVLVFNVAFEWLAVSQDRRDERPVRDVAA